MTLTQWVHLAGTYDGNTLRLYRNGQQVATATAPGGMNQCSGITAVGSRNSQDQHWFPGAIDEVRIYGRALPAQEIVNLYNAGWQAAKLAQSGDAVERTSWSTTVPAGLEGAYQIEMRGRDAAGHAEAVSEPSLLWRGEADNLKPRVTLSKKVVNSTTNEYTTVAEDYHLAETDFNSPCGAGVVTARETFRSPWYLGSTGDSQRLYRLTVVCQKTGAVTEQAQACDSFGNCAAVGVTAAAAQVEGRLPELPPGGQQATIRRQRATAGHRHRAHDADHHPHL